VKIFGSRSISDGSRGPGPGPGFIELQHDLNVTRVFSIIAFVVGIFLICLKWKSTQTSQETLDIFSILFWALACWASGGLLGFLFGIPRVLQRLPELGASRLEAAPKVSRSHSAYELIINTNLDDVSDWLTKIVVGVGLVEMEKVPGAIHRLALVIAGEQGNALAPLVTAVMIYFTIVGFITGYLTTRMFFQRAFRIADRAASESGAHEIIEEREVKSSAEMVLPAEGRGSA
jgi:hypothetical protein